MTRNNLLSEKLNYTGASHTPTHLHFCTYNTEIQVSRRMAGSRIIQIFA